MNEYWLLLMFVFSGDHMVSTVELGVHEVRAACQAERQDNEKRYTLPGSQKSRDEQWGKGTVVTFTCVRGSSSRGDYSVRPARKVNS